MYSLEIVDKCRISLHVAFADQPHVQQISLSSPPAVPDRGIYVCIIKNPSINL